jgi:hypothetical protein
LKSFWVAASHCRNGESARKLPDFSRFRGRSLSTGLSTDVAGAGGNVGSRRGLKAGDSEQGRGMSSRDRPGAVKGPATALFCSDTAAFLASASAHAAFCASALLRTSGATFSH